MNIERQDVQHFIFMLVINIIWVIINRKRYKESIKKVTGKDTKLSFIGVILSYTSLVLSFMYFSRKLDETLDMAVLGLCLYGVLNTTNMAMFGNWDVITVLMDTVWGGILFGLTHLIMNDETIIKNTTNTVGSFINMALTR